MEKESFQTKEKNDVCEHFFSELGYFDACSLPEFGGYSPPSLNPEAP